MLGDPRVIGRALERQIERELDAAVVAHGEEVREVVESAELGGNRVMAAVFVADRPRAPGIVDPRGGRSTQTGDVVS